MAFRSWSSLCLVGLGLLLLTATWHRTTAQGDNNNEDDSEYYDDVKRAQIIYPSSIPFGTLESNLFASINASTPALLKGIFGNYSRSASASPFIIWAPNGYPVALGASGDFALPVVVAVELPSSSRLVAFGHESIPSDCCSSNDDWDKLTLNAIRWMAGRRSLLRMASSRIDWARDALPSVQRALRSLALSTSFMDLDTFTRGGWDYVDIYWIDTYAEYTPAQVSALLSFANQPGKGLLVAGQIWVWGFNHPGANILTESPINRVLWPLGLAITPDVQTGFLPAPFKPPLPTTPFYNARYVTSLLAHIKARGATPMPKGYFPTANGAIKQLLKWLPPRSASGSAPGLDELWSLVDVGRMGNSPAASSGVPLDPLIGQSSKVLDAYVDSTSNLYSDLTALKASRSAKAFPGAVSPAIPRVSLTININGNYGSQPYNMPYGRWAEPVWRSTGLYAPPGQLITVTLISDHALAQGLQVQIGAHTDDLSYEHVWKRVPYSVTRFDLFDVTTYAGNPLGGLVYILVPPGSALGNVQITISNAIQVPYFRLGITDRLTWNRTIRNYDAPWVELDSGKLVLTLPPLAIRSLSDPTPLMRHWNLVMDHIATITSLPKDRIRAERLVLDTDTAGGWIHAGYPVVMYDTMANQRTLADVAQLQAKGSWWAYHLLANNHLLSETLFPGAVEALNNIITIYVLEQMGVPSTAWENWAYVSPEGRAAKRTEYFSYGAHWDTDWWGFTATDTLLQLKDSFGWDFYRRVFAAYQNREPQEDAVQTWIVVTSQAAGFNLVPFYNVWNFPVSDVTVDTVSSLPFWEANPFNL